MQAIACMMPSCFIGDCTHCYRHYDDEEKGESYECICKCHTENRA